MANLANHDDEHCEGCGCSFPTHCHICGTEVVWRLDAVFEVNGEEVKRYEILCPNGHNLESIGGDNWKS